jgi:hypothetical protein
MTALYGYMLNIYNTQNKNVYRLLFFVFAWIIFFFLFRSS